MQVCKIQGCLAHGSSVVALYTRTSGRHAFVNTINTLADASYISVQLYVPFTRGSWTSNACSGLGCPTFVQLPPAHIVFAFETFKIVRSDALIGGRTILTLTPDTKTADIINSFKASAKQLHAAVKAHKSAMRMGSANHADASTDSEEGEDE